MLDAITLYLRYRSSCVISLRIVMTNLDLLSCTSRKGKTDSDLIRNAVLLWNNVVLCAIFERKRVRFRFLRSYAVFCAVLTSIDDLFFSCEFALRFVNQITVWIDDSFFCVDELSFRRRFWPAWARKISLFDFWLATQSSVKLLSRMKTCFDRTIVLYNLSIESTTRFTCTRCWLQIFCKLCLSEELNNLINIDRAVTALYSRVELTHSRKARQ